MKEQHFDIIIIGAGLSGIGTAKQLKKDHPGKRMAILERRARVGGTWDLFKYPGIRSDSDMLSYGYEERLWASPNVLAEGSEIRDYIEETADESGLNAHIQCGIRIVSANWSSEMRTWQLNAVHEPSGAPRTYACKFMICCTGYYNHDEGYLPHFPGEQDFLGQQIHPQHWPEDLDYRDKQVVVIGSGATAVTLIPSMAGQTKHITMLQRSPSYIYALPGRDKITDALLHIMPANWARKLARKRNIMMYRAIYLACRAWPNFMRRRLLSHVRKQVGPNADMRHFTPSYMPWDERLAAVPDGDMFKAIREGKASVETGQIERFTSNGILLKSGKELPADIIITATGLKLQLLGGMQLSINGTPYSIGDQMTYKGVLLENLPNMAWIFGYTNVSWTLKVGLASRYLGRLLSYMEKNQLEVVTPRDEGDNALDDGIMNSMKSGYIQRDQHFLPRQGKSHPWEVFMHYGRDKKMLLNEPISDYRLEFLPLNSRGDSDDCANVVQHPSSATRI